MYKEGMVWVWIAYNSAQADKPGKAVQERELDIAKWHCENTAPTVKNKVW